MKGNLENIICEVKHYTTELLCSSLHMHSNTAVLPEHLLCATLCDHPIIFFKLFLFIYSYSFSLLRAVGVIG